MEASTLYGQEIPIDLIDLSGKNPRKKIKGEGFEEFKDSIKEIGLKDEILVRPNGKRYELVNGERRFTACKELGWKTIRSTVEVIDDQTVQLIMLAENIQRKALEPLEEAAALEEIVKTGVKQEDLAKRLSKSQPWVANRIRLNKAPPELQKLLIDEKISPQHVVVMLPYVEHKELKDEIIQGIKDHLDDEYEGPFTVDRAKDLVAEVLDEQGQNLDLNDYASGGLDKYFDFSKCDTCEKTLKLAGEGSKKKTEKHCLDKNCFAEHRDAAEAKLSEVTAERVEKQKEKGSKAGVVNTKNLSYSDYTGLERATFDTIVCEGCPNHKLRKPEYARSGKGKDELEEICLKPSCFRGKTAQVTKGKNQKVRKELTFADESLDIYLAGRAEGFTAEELMYIRSRVIEIVSHTYGRGDDRLEAKKSAKDPWSLENAILRLLVKEQLGPLRTYLHMDSLKDAEKDWPFEVTREEPGPKAEARRYSRVIISTPEKCGGCSKDLPIGAKAFKETHPPHEVLCPVCGRKENERLRSAEAPKASCHSDARKGSKKIVAEKRKSVQGKRKKKGRSE